MKLLTSLSSLLSGQNRFVRVVLPLVLIVLVLAGLNLGLYSRLSPAEAFDTFVLPYSQDFKSVEVHRWFSGAGAWRVTGGVLSQTDPNAEGAQLLIPHWLVNDAPYRFSAEILSAESFQSAGLVFNAQYPDVFLQGHRVFIRRAEGGMELVAGYTDAEGIFEAQIVVPLTGIEAPYTLAVLIDPVTYAVEVNGRSIIADRPLKYQNGLVGFLASGDVSFDNAMLTAPEKPPVAVDVAAVDTAANPLPIGDLVYTSSFGGAGAAGWVTISGEWDVVNGRLTQSDPSGIDFSTAYAESAFQSYYLQVLLTLEQGTGAGVLFNMPSPYQLNGSHLVRFANTGNGIYWGYFDENGAFVGQGHAKLPVEAGRQYSLKIASGASSYSVSLNDQIIEENIPLVSTAGHVGLITSQSRAGYSLVDVSALLTTPGAGQAAGGQPVSTPVLQPEKPAVTVNPVPENGFTLDAGFYAGGFGDRAVEGRWIPIRGAWEARGGRIVQTQAGGFDNSIGYGGEIFERVQLQVPFTHLEGVGGGVLVNMPDPGGLAWATMVRFTEQGDKLLWGYFNGDAKFVGVGSAEVPAPGASEQLLTILAGETTYEIRLNGETVATGVPLARKRGFIGLATTRSAASFGPITVLDKFSGDPAADRVTAFAGADIGGSMRVISGDWTNAGGVFTQVRDEAEDFVLSTGVFAGVYSLETTIRLPDAPAPGDAGGGIIFHMPEMESRAQAHLVRLAAAGSGVYWGYFDDNEVFVGQGYAEFTPSEEAPLAYKLRIAVRRDVYDLYVNDNLIAADIPLVKQDGFIGLLAYRGPVVFDQVNISIGGQP